MKNPEESHVVRLGRWNHLIVTRTSDYGLYLDGGRWGEILMPRRYVPQGCGPGDEVEVFVYLDQEERLVATTETPLAQVGDFACLRVAWTNRFGAFLHWGLMKDLFVPFREQKMRMEKDRSYIVYIHVDKETGRIVGTAKVEKYLETEYPHYRAGEPVDILVWQKTDLGLKAIVDNRYAGLLYDEACFRSLHMGDRLTAYIKQVRPDGKIDLTLQRPGMKGVEDFAAQLYERLCAAGGVLPYSDNSEAEAIYEAFGVSKKTFKRAIGQLYRQQRITLGENEICLSGED